MSGGSLGPSQKPEAGRSREALSDEARTSVEAAQVKTRVGWCGQGSHEFCSGPPRHSGGKNGVGKNGVGKNGVGKNGVGKNGVGKNGVGKNGVGKNGVGKNGGGEDGVGGQTISPWPMNME
ncbi:spidroin-1-like [Dermacentor silvarum]|uniref:spidroin-1-like n=1 Tax=Dermacentor silvarum TaxID=543639 RepID=UPI001898B364|nr:spidroin-1-like [Dermacentor silvarum]